MHRVLLFFFIAATLSSCALIIEYLDVFSLFSSKYLNYQDFRTVHFMMVVGSYLTPSGLYKIISIKQSFNDSRTVFTFYHFFYFYP